MTHATRTIIFAAVAAISASLAAATHYFNRPVPLEGFELVGEEFFPDFKDPSEAKALRVAAYNPDTASIKEFNVEFKDGMWRIPSHHYYPADAEDRLAKTAASVIGIQRGALITRSAADHERLGVIDPLSQDATELKGRGKRITLLGAGDVVLADLIIGDDVPDREHHYYVRRPDEKAVYVTEVDIDLSTKFADWIESDLLKMQRDDLREIVINKYSVDESEFPRVRIRGQEVNTLTKGPEFSDPWKLEGLNEATEEVKADEVRKLAGNIDNLKIVGVRPKPQGLKPDLSLDSEVATNPLLQQALLGDLASKGFLLAQSNEGLQLISNEGEISAATDEGVVYDLRFGQIFTGDESEIEIGSGSKSQEEDAAAGDEKNAKADASETKDKDEAAADAASDEKKDKNASDDEKKDNLAKSRYLMVSVRFDPKYIGPEPVKPEEPKAPEGSESASEESAKTEEASPDAGQGADEKKQEAAESDGKAESGEKKDAESKDDKEDSAADDAHKIALEKYKADLKKYEEDKKEYDKKVEDGKKKVDELNERFGAWYYVISAESFENLRLSRADLVKPKEEKKEAPPADQPGSATGTDSTAPVAPEAPATKPAEDATKTPASEPAKEEPAKEESAQPPSNTEPEAKEPQPEPKAEAEPEANADSPNAESPASSPDEPQAGSEEGGSAASQ